MPALPSDDLDDPALLFLQEMVEPTVLEFLAAPDDKRRGCLACLVLSSMTEHYFHARPALAGAGLAAFKAAIRKDNQAVGWIADVANATKHVRRHGRQGTSRLGYGDVRSEEMGQCDMIQADWPIEGEEVLVGPDWDWRLSDLIEATMAFWQGKVGGVGSGEASSACAASNRRRAVRGWHRHDIPS